jgi:hypothetical protein
MLIWKKTDNDESVISHQSFMSEVMDRVDPPRIVATMYEGITIAKTLAVEDLSEIELVTVTDIHI